MVEIERNPLAVRQGAATIVCLAAAAVAMPVISHRAAEQRSGAEWSVTSTAFAADFQSDLLASTDPSARVELASVRTGDGLRARGSAPLFENADARAMMVQAVLRGPSSVDAVPAAPSAEPRIDPRQHHCLSQAIYYEARGETQRGQVAVAEVIMNRVASRHYPNTICGVVYQGSHRSTGCQFTFTCDGSLGRQPRGRAWDRAQRVATAVMSGYARPMTQHATHYHTTGVNPVWNSGLVRTTQIGVHLFYRLPNAAERPHYQQALDRRRGLTRRGGAGPEANLIPETDDQVIEAGEGEAIDAPAPAATEVDDSAANSDSAADVAT